MCGFTWVHVRRAVTEGLRLRGVYVLTAQEDGARELSDPELLDRADALSRLLFTQDNDLLREAKARQNTGKPFAGVVYAHQLNCQCWPMHCRPGTHRSRQ